MHMHADAWTRCGTKEEGDGSWKLSLRVRESLSFGGVEFWNFSTFIVWAFRLKRFERLKRF